MSQRRHGVLVVDKPTGPTSFDVIARVRRALGERRVGHTGTLDPLASGVLPICIGEATKLVQFLAADDKAYEAEAILGVTTDTEDALGRPVEVRDAAKIDEAMLRSTLAAMVGPLRQIPPMYSAIKVDGERLYARARRGEVIEREARQVYIHALELRALRIEEARARVAFSVSCSKGTYVRTLAAELGARLGVGGHLSALRRTRSGAFGLGQATPLDVVEATRGDDGTGPGGGRLRLIGLAEALGHLPRLDLDAAAVPAVRQGKVSVVDALSASAGLTRLLDPEGSLVAVVRREGVRIRLERVFNEVDFPKDFGRNTAT